MVGAISHIIILQPMEHTNHKFPAATATGVPSEVKSTVHRYGGRRRDRVILYCLRKRDS